MMGGRYPVVPAPAPVFALARLPLDTLRTMYVQLRPASANTIHARRLPMLSREQLVAAILEDGSHE